MWKQLRKEIQLLQLSLSLVTKDQVRHEVQGAPRHPCQINPVDVGTNRQRAAPTVYANEKNVLVTVLVD